MVTLTPSFQTGKVCYAYLTRYKDVCIDCKRGSRCRLQQSKLLDTLTEDDKLILKAVIGEAEELDTGAQSDQMLNDVLSQKAHITLRVAHLSPELVYGVSYDNV